MDTKGNKDKRIIPIICLILSFGLWLYISNVENPTITYKLDKISVEIVNADELTKSNLVLAPNQNIQVDLQLEGARGDIYSAKKDQFKVTLDLGAYALKKGNNNIPVEIIDYPSNINIKSDRSLRVNVVIDELKTKEVEVKQELNVSAKEGYYLGETNISSTKVNVTGPGEYVDMIQNVIAKGEYLNLASDMNSNITLQPQDIKGNMVENVKMDPSSVNVTIPIRQLKPVKVNVKTVGQLKADMILKEIIPLKTYVEIQGDEALKKDVSEVNTEPIDLSNINGNNNIEVKLDLPKGIKSADNTVKVKIVVEKNITKSFSIPVTIKGIEAGLEATLSKNETTIVLKGSETLINKLNSNMFKGEVDLTSLDEGVHDVTPKVTYDNSVGEINIISEEKIKATLAKKNQ